MAFDITVESIRPPEPGKKKAMVKTTEGRYWLVWADKMQDFQPGAQATITKWDTWQSPQGRKYYTVMEYQVPGVTAQGGSSNSRPQSQYQPRQQPSNPPPIDDEKRQLQIFICGAFNNIMANPNIDPRAMKMMEMMDVIHQLKGAWLGVFGPSPLPRQARPDPISTSGNQGYQGAINQLNNDDMGGDDIPF